MADKYIDLKDKTILDFNPSDDALDEIIGGHTQEDKEQYLRGLEDKTPFGCGGDELKDMSQGLVYRAETFMYLTDFIDDERLKEAIVKEYGEVYDLVHNE